MPPSPNSYSFTAVQATLTGPGGTVILGKGSGADKGGITCAPKEERNIMKIGADGTPMHSLKGGAPGRFTFRILKVAPVNGVLSAMYNLQKSSVANWGQNTLVVSDLFRGDIESLTQAAFVGLPTVVYDEEGPMNEWVFDGVQDMELGAGVPNVNTASGF